MAADRGAFIDQSQSLNLFIAKPTYANCTSMHFYAWQKVIFQLLLSSDENRSIHASFSPEYYSAFSLSLSLCSSFSSPYFCFLSMKKDLAEMCS